MFRSGILIKKNYPKLFKMLMSIFAITIALYAAGFYFPSKDEKFFLAAIQQSLSAGQVFTYARNVTNFEWDYVCYNSYYGRGYYSTNIEIAKKLDSSVQNISELLPEQSYLGNTFDSPYQWALVFIKEGQIVRVVPIKAIKLDIDGIRYFFPKYWGEWDEGRYEGVCQSWGKAKLTINKKLKGISITEMEIN